LIDVLSEIIYKPKNVGLPVKIFKNFNTQYVVYRWTVILSFRYIVFYIHDLKVFLTL